MRALSRCETSLLPSDNEWGVPVLDPAMQAVELPLPCRGWGAVARGAAMASWHCYVDDYRFGRLLQQPEQIVESGARVAVEPNISIFEEQPLALALAAVYRKRWVARLWQNLGVRVLVDLNVAARARTLNMTGVPRGWGAFATRLYANRLLEAEAEYAFARDWAGRVPHLFVSIGGGRAGAELARARGWVHLDG